MNLLKRKTHPSLPSNLPTGRKIVILQANGFGLGKFPVASGTVGALLGLPLAIALPALHGHVWLQVAVVACLIYLCVPLCYAAEKIYGAKDDGRIVADEYLFPPSASLPNVRLGTCSAQANGSMRLFSWAWPLSSAASATSSRPIPPANCRRCRGGVVVLDYVFADVYAWGVIWVAAAWILTPHVQPFLYRLVLGR